MGRFAVALASILVLALGACGSKSGGAAACARAAMIDDDRPGACRGAGSVLSCVRPDGRGCFCATDGRGCPGCDPNEGAVCRDECRPDEYAASCGAGNGTEPPAGGPIVVVYDDPPANCRLVDLGVGLPSIYCCPCQ